MTAQRLKKNTPPRREARRKNKYFLSLKRPVPCRERAAGESSGCLYAIFSGSRCGFYTGIFRDFFCKILKKLCRDGIIKKTIRVIK